MTIPKKQKFDKATAIKHVNGMEDAQDKWKDFDCWVNEQVDSELNINKGSVIKALIIEASDLSLQCAEPGGEKVKAICENFRKDTVKKVMKRVSVEDGQLVIRKYASIRTLISLAKKNEGGESSDKGGAAQCEGNPGKSPAPKKTKLFGIPFKEVEAELPLYLNGLSGVELEIVWQLVNTEHNARKEKPQLMMSESRGGADAIAENLHGMTT